ncbi:MAG TPA: DUF6152 family protein [Bryobacteraceae bacterium]|jgi:hypothetical protein
MRLHTASALALGLLLSVMPALAHHSFAMFDSSKTTTLVGTVTDFQWTNPHSYIEMDVPNDSGGVKHWSVEMGSPSILQPGGWKHTTLKTGDKVTVVLNPLKNGDPGGLLVQANLPDGRKLGNGPGRGPAKQ